MENGNWLTTAEFAKRTGRSVSNVTSRARKGEIKKTKRGEELRNGLQTILIHESEVVNHIKKTPVSNGHKPANRMKPEIEDGTFEDVSLRDIKDFQFEVGKIPYKNLAAAVALAMKRESWENIHFATGVKELVVKRLIGELKRAEAEAPGQYKTVMDYLWAGRPFSKGNEKMPRKREKK